MQVKRLVRKRTSFVDFGYHLLTQSHFDNNKLASHWGFSCVTRCNLENLAVWTEGQ